MYEDDFEFAERERADTWDGEVNLKVNSHIKWVVTSSIACVKWFLPVHIYSSASPPQVSLRAEKGQKGEPAIIEPVSCERHLMNSPVAFVMSVGMSWCSANVHFIYLCLFPGHISRRTSRSTRATGKPVHYSLPEQEKMEILTVPCLCN